MGWTLPTAGACHAAVLTPHRIRARSSDNAGGWSRPSRGAMPAAGARVVPSPMPLVPEPLVVSSVVSRFACAYVRNPLKSSPRAGFRLTSRCLRRALLRLLPGRFLRLRGGVRPPVRLLLLVPAPAHLRPRASGQGSVRVAQPSGAWPARAFRCCGVAPSLAYAETVERAGRCSPWRPGRCSPWRPSGRSPQSPGRRKRSWHPAALKRPRRPCSRGQRPRPPAAASCVSGSLVSSSSLPSTRRRPQGCGRSGTSPGGNGRLLPDQMGLATLAWGGERRPHPRKGLRMDGMTAAERWRD